MAENQEERSGEDLGDEVSQHRLEDFRKKGQVAQSKELTGLLALLAAGAATYSFAPQAGAMMLEYMREVLRADVAANVNLGSNEVLGQTLMRAVRVMALIGLPISIVGFVIGIAGSFVQIGAIFSTEPLTPDLSKIDPFKGIQRLVSMKQLTEAIRLILKMTFTTAVIYALVKSQIFVAPAHIDQEAGSLLQTYGRSAMAMFLSIIGVLLVFAVVDFGLLKWDYNKQLRLTKQEAKQEFKEREGDPQIKARVRAVQREVARRRMMAAVKKADVIVTNPTHIAVAITYEKDNMSAPKVVAKGADFLAERIKKIAAEAGVPLVENVPLARTLFKTVKVNQPVPRALYQAVAEVLAYVYRLKGRRSL